MNSELAKCQVHRDRFFNIYGLHAVSVMCVTLGFKVLLLPTIKGVSILQVLQII